MAFNTILAGMKLTPARLNALDPVFAAIKLSDTSRSSTTTLANDPDLQGTVVASAVYLVTLNVAHTYDQSGDFKFAFTGPSGATMVNWGFHYRDLNGNEISGTSATLTAAVSVTATSGSTIQPLWVMGTLLTSVTAGTFAFQWAQNTSSGSASTVKAGSSLQLVRVS